LDIEVNYGAHLDGDQRGSEFPGLILGRIKIPLKIV
jgi:hypothetical protein